MYPAVHIVALGGALPVGADVGPPEGKVELGKGKGAEDPDTGGCDEVIATHGHVIVPVEHMDAVTGDPLDPVVCSLLDSVELGRGYGGDGDDVGDGGRLPQQGPVIEPAIHRGKVLDEFPVGPAVGEVVFVAGTWVVDINVVAVGVTKQGPLIDPPEHDEPLVNRMVGTDEVLEVGVELAVQGPFISPPVQILDGEAVPAVGPLVTVEFCKGYGAAVDPVPTGELLPVGPNGAPLEFVKGYGAEDEELMVERVVLPDSELPEFEIGDDPDVDAPGEVGWLDSVPGALPLGPNVG
jgi:hypothetical protein